MDQEIRAGLRYLVSNRDYEALFQWMSLQDLDDLIKRASERRERLKREDLEKTAIYPIQTSTGQTSSTPICLEQTCPWKKDCAQHDTSGDFRSEDGMTPNLACRNGQWFCSKTEQPHHGMIVVRKVGPEVKLFTYQEDPLRWSRSNPGLSRG